MRRLIHIEGLSVGYGNQPAAENISFDVMEGDYICITGENGSGKTTLMRTMLSLLQPIKGTIQFDSDFSNQMIGWLPQHQAVQSSFPASVYEIILSGCRQKTIYPFYTKQEKERVFRCMQELSILDLRNRGFQYLSGGQQQKVLLARALCSAKEMLMMDEPTAGLDPSSSAEMYRLIQELNQKGTTILMITHDVNNALQYPNHILAMNEHPVFMRNDQCIQRGCAVI
jgi:zinc transport system ATP-binding protein